MDNVMKDYREDLMERLRENPEFAWEYLLAALQQGDGAFTVASKDVMDAEVKWVS